MLLQEGDAFVKVQMRGIAMVLAVAAVGLVAAGCAGGSKDSKKDSSALTGVKGDSVKRAQKDFDKNPKDINACVNLGQSWIAYASPDAPKKAGDPVKPPKDRMKSLGKAATTLETCTKLDAKSEAAQQMLASTYMGMSKYEKAAPILHDIAIAHKTDANAWYAWGLAESSALNSAKTVEAWKQFIRYAYKADTRVKPTKEQIKALEAEIAAKKKAAGSKAGTK